MKLAPSDRQHSTMDDDEQGVPRLHPISCLLTDDDVDDVVKSSEDSSPDEFLRGCSLWALTLCRICRKK